MLIHKTWLRFVIIVISGFALFPFLPTPAPVAADGIVTNCSNDSQLSGFLPQGGTISFSCDGAYTITVSSEKVISGSLSIDGANGGFPIVLSGGGVRRVFSISGVNVFLSNMTVTNGRAQFSNGGNILNTGTLHLTDVTVSNGQVTTSGIGGGGKGGGIYNTGSLIIRQSTVSGNTASFNLSAVSGDGGGIYSTGSIDIANSTVSGNSAGGIGGGVVSSGAASSLLNDTLANNSAGNDGGNLDASGSLTLKNTILAGGGSNFNCSITTTFTSQGHNLSDDTSCTSLMGGDLKNTPANLGALANNGGQTMTHLPQPGSSAINNGTNIGCPPEDQRHIARPQGGTCDIGSVEVSAPATIASLVPNSRAAGTAGFQLQVNGGTFGPGATVLWNGSARPTHFDGSTSVTASIPASDLNAVGTATISVQNSGTTPSNGLSFSVFDAGDLVTDCSEYGLDAAIFNGGNITFTCGPATITISAQKVIGSNTTIDGGNKVSISGGAATGIFSVTAGTHLDLANLTLSNGNVSLSCLDGGAIHNAGTLGVTNVSFISNTACNGGAIDNQGTATVTSSSFMSNTASSGQGGAIDNSTSMTVTNSLFTRNVAAGISGHGGGLNNGGTLVVIGSTFTGNSSGRWGGGVNNEANANIDNSTVISNSSGSFGGGIHNGAAGALIVSASRILSNTAPNGGGLNNDGTQIVSTSFFTGNVANMGGGINNRGTLTITASAMARNSASAAGGGIFNASGTLRVIGSTFTGNNGGNRGGGVDNEANANVDSSTFTSNSATSLGGGIHNGGPGGTMIVSASRMLSNTAQYGGGLNNDGTQIVSTSFFTGNMASVGGGINNRQGTLNISASALVGNVASGAGGGIANENSLNITGSTLSANVSVNGAGIVSTGTLVVNASTFNLNSASSDGGGIANAGGLAVTNSTFSANSAANFGGGIDSSTSLSVTTTILNSTLVSNTSSLGGSLYHNGGPVMLKNTIVAFSAPQNCAGPQNLTTLGHNLESGTTCNFTGGSDLNTTDPKIGPLQNNGGPTLTHGLLRGSPAIDAGDNAGCPATDQRGVTRPLDGDGDGVAVCDIGAYEANQLFNLFLPLIRR